MLLYWKAEGKRDEGELCNLAGILAKYESVNTCVISTWMVEYE